MSKKKTTTSIPKNPISKKELLKKAKKSITEGAVELSKSDVSNFSAEINTSGITQCIYLLAIDVNKGWENFDCNSMKEFIEKEFPNNYDALNRNLVAARIAVKLGGIKLIGQFSDNALQPLNKLSVEDCIKVMEKVKNNFVGEYDTAKVTKKLVLEAMYKLKLKPRPSSKMEKPQDPFKDFAMGYKFSPTSFIPNIADNLLKYMTRTHVTQLIETLQTGIKKR
ncbi:hypothetical protein [Rheinheimera hassiensis]|uniref:hypothetical protein n=1 Tax=Rheinheimera hassiensis TaxID=1193627 RepID=UPI001F05EC42|nr:hypothetical protein [Rheinheimera hassiensis]